jgi:CheY-like chemotaxis protein
MGGTVSVESEPGRGSTFKVVIPNVAIAAQLPASETDPADARINLNDFPPSEILVVDDNPVNRDLLAGIFEGTHLLMDVRMPVMTGTEALQKMRTEPDLQSIPVIAVTASSLLSEEGAVRRNFSGYLRKPFSRTELYRQIAHFLPQRSRTVPVLLPPVAVEAPKTGTQVAGWENAVRRLRQMQSSSWPVLQKTLAITEAKEFACRLLTIADQADCPPLRSYAADLNRHADSFAADDLERHLAAFPQLIELLEERITHTTAHAAE